MWMYRIPWWFIPHMLHVWLPGPSHRRLRASGHWHWRQAVEASVVSNGWIQRIYHTDPGFVWVWYGSRKNHGQLLRFFISTLGLIKKTCVMVWTRGFPSHGCETHVQSHPHQTSSFPQFFCGGWGRKMMGICFSFNSPLHGLWQPYYILLSFIIQNLFLVLEPRPILNHDVWEAWGITCAEWIRIRSSPTNRRRGSIILFMFCYTWKITIISKIYFVVDYQRFAMRCG